MKKYLSFIIIIAFLCSFGGKTFAQLTEYEWDEYKVAFSVPDYLKVVKSDENEFTAKGGVFTMSLKPWKNAAITEVVDVAQKAFDKTPGDNKEIVDQAKEAEEVNGYKMHWVVGHGSQNGKVMIMILAGYLDPKTSTNFTLQLLFWQNEAKDDENIKTCMKIIESIKAMN